MTQPQSFTPKPLYVTPSAIDKMRKLQEAESNHELMLRVYVTGGGCSGFQYGFSFESESAEDDTIVEEHGVRIVVDAMSFPYLAGSEVDYQEDLMGSQFKVRNPNATTTCGCGASFSI